MFRVRELREGGTVRRVLDLLRRPGVERTEVFERVLRLRDLALSQGDLGPEAEQPDALRRIGHLRFEGFQGRDRRGVILPEVIEEESGLVDEQA